MAEYIEKNKFREELINTPFYPRCKTTPDLLTSVQDRLNATLELLDGMPPADVRPVVRGRWIVNQTAMGTNYSVCSECEKEFCFRPDYGTLIKIDLSGTNYCPNCGADMREEADP